MKKPAVARGVVVIQNATPIEPEPGTVPVTEDDDKVLVEIRVSRFFVYDGEEGAQFQDVQRERQFGWRRGMPRLSRDFNAGPYTERVFLGLDDVEKHAFVQKDNGMLTPFGAMEMQAWMNALGWDYRELGQRAGVAAGACRDALLMTASATNTYPKMLAAIRVGLHAKSLIDAKKAKVA